MFHITPKKNWDSIRGSGLIPAKMRGISCCSYRDRAKMLWFTDNIFYILSTQCGIHWIKNKEPVILNMDLKGLELNPYSWGGNVAPHEWTYSGVISPERILSVSTVSEDMIADIQKIA